MCIRDRLSFYQLFLERFKTEESLNHKKHHKKVFEIFPNADALTFNVHQIGKITTRCPCSTEVITNSPLHITSAFKHDEEGM